MFSPETPATPAASHGPHAPAHPASLFAQAIQNNVAAHQRASQLTSGLAAARDALAAAVLDADFEAPDTTPTRASAASAAPAPAVRIPEQTRVHSTDSLLTPIVIPAPSTPSLPLDAMSQSSARSSVLVATGTSADKKAAQAMPQSPSINEAKLDSLDRFTMVKSRIV
nr:hypothetical protein HK105_004824 [Polyrhizophydium stewartii]